MEPEAPLAFADSIYSADSDFDKLASVLGPMQHSGPGWTEAEHAKSQLQSSGNSGVAYSVYSESLIGNRDTDDKVEIVDDGDLTARHSLVSLVKPRHDAILHCDHCMHPLSEQNKIGRSRAGGLDSSVLFVASDKHGVVECQTAVIFAIVLLPVSDASAVIDAKECCRYYCSHHPLIDHTLVSLDPDALKLEPVEL